MRPTYEIKVYVIKDQIVVDELVDQSRTDWCKKGKLFAAEFTLKENGREVKYSSCRPHLCDVVNDVVSQISKHATLLDHIRIKFDADEKGDKIPLDKSEIRAFESEFAYRFSY
jgi:hypothetical protein